MVQHLRHGPHEQPRGGGSPLLGELPGQRIAGVLGPLELAARQLPEPGAMLGIGPSALDQQHVIGAPDEACRHQHGSLVARHLGRAPLLDGPGH